MLHQYAPDDIFYGIIYLLNIILQEFYINTVTHLTFRN